jgi:hypothetical protein
MKFQPKSESEIINAGLLEEGIYDFNVSYAEDKVSRAGKDMIELKLTVFDKEGKEKIIRDYLLEAMSFKLRHFCEVTGLIEKYNKGEFTADDCLGKSGKVSIKIQKGDVNPNGGFYPDKNSVKDYVKSELKQVENKDNFESDDVPF